jgi:hypothetical protein
MHLNDIKSFIEQNIERSHLLREKIDLDINNLTTKLNNLNDEKTKLLNMPGEEYNYTINLIRREIFRLSSNIKHKVSNKSGIIHAISNNSMELKICYKVLKCFEKYNLSGDNIICKYGCMITSNNLFRDFNEELLKEYMDFYGNIDKFDIDCYFVELEAHIQFSREVVQKAINNWMVFYHQGPNIEQRYILNVINSSAGIHGWAK